MPEAVDRNVIVVASNPRGVFLEGVIDGTPKPGTVMQVKAGVDPDSGGRLTYEAYNKNADGDASEIIVLREDWGQGKTIDDAYVSGSRGFLYVPANGEELMMLVANQSGTGEAFTIGESLSIDDGTGMLVEAAGNTKPFVVMEEAGALTADTHVLCRYSANQ